MWRFDLIWNDFVFAFLFLLALLFGTTGCNSSLFNQHVKDMEVMRGTAVEVVSRLSNSGVGQAAGSLQGIDPGINVEFGTKYFCVARYAGVAGALTFSAQGNLDRQLSPERVELIDAILNDTTLSSAAKRAQIFDAIMSRLPPPSTQPETP
mgnify:CR=1 FL=1